MVVSGKEKSRRITPAKTKPLILRLLSLLPSTDPERAKIIRSSRWGGNRVELSNVPNARYTVFLYVWEDNQPETYNVFVNDLEVLSGYNTKREGYWERLGPWVTDSRNDQIMITSTGGTANFSVIEIWRGQHDGSNVVPIPDDQLAFFEKTIRPLFIRHCYECYSEKSNQVEGHLLVNSAPTLLHGGSTGPAIID